ncbi:hypothetical protein [Pseudarthrobacter oxydans]
MTSGRHLGAVDGALQGFVGGLPAARDSVRRRRAAAVVLLTFSASA